MLQCEALRAQVRNPDSHTGMDLLYFSQSISKIFIPNDQVKLLYGVIEQWCGNRM